MYLDPMPSQQLITSRRDAAFSLDDAEPSHESLAGIHRLIEQYQPPPGKLLQIGCGRGDFLVSAREKGWEAHGIETYAPDFERARARLGEAVFHGSLTESPFEPGSYDVVVLWHVLEGIPQPLEFLRQVRSYLRPGGALAMQVAGMADLQGALEEGRPEELVWVARLSYFTMPTFSRIIKQAGLVHDLCIEDPKTGFLIAVVRRPDWPDPVHLDGCPLCGSGRSWVFLQHLDPKFLCLLDRCESCGFTYLNPIPSDDLIRDWQDEDLYYDHHEADLQLMENILDYSEMGVSPPGRLLEIGCSQGDLLVAAAKRGWEAHGVEISPSDFAHAQARLGDKVFNGQLADSPFQQESYDLIVLWHVLEHIPHPRRFLKEARSYLRPGGVLTLQVPGLSSLDFLRDQGRISELVCPVHLSYFQRHTLRWLLESAGFEIDDLGVEAGTEHLTARVRRPAS